MLIPKFRWMKEEGRLRRGWDGWLKGVKMVLADSVMNMTIKLSLAVVAIGFLIIILRWFHLPPEVPLFYSSPWGEDQLAEQTYLLILPMLALMIVGFNFLVSGVLVRFEAMAGIILNSASLGVAILAVITLFRIVSLVG